MAQFSLSAVSLLLMMTLVSAHFEITQNFSLNMPGHDAIYEQTCYYRRGINLLRNLSAYNDKHLLRLVYMFVVSYYIQNLFYTVQNFRFSF